MNRDRSRYTRAVTSRASEVLDAALALSREERAELAAILTDSVGGESSPEQVLAAWVAESKRRLEAYERGELKTVGYDDMMRQLRAKYPPRQASTG